MLGRCTIEQAHDYLPQCTTYYQPGSSGSPRDNLI
jgi:hypothetical protein